MVNLLCEKRYGLLDQADESCTIGTFTGQCNVRETRQGIILQHTMMSMALNRERLDL
ncbi:MAG: hypothetical protein Ct9H90mP14_0300 [Methanobacteriota archaeon]|nr:MAG: hypothetical protein Ct9H90mP14_0300 [Euryarchaeota archaeon]